MRRLPIRWKLLLVTLLTCTLVQLIVGVVLAGYDSQMFRTQKSREVESAAAILAAAVSASLTFNDLQATHEYLDALIANPEIDAAAVYGVGGKLFAGYSKSANSAPLPVRAQPPGLRFLNDRVVVYAPVVVGSDQSGSVYLRSMFEPLEVRLLRYAGIVLAALAGSMAIAVPIAMRLNRAIAEPIREIAAAARHITAGDLNVDLPPSEDADEIGLLRQAFRQMIMSLREMTAELERRVLQRTAQLEAANKELEAFSYSVSHDLRAPLRAIDGFSRMIEEDYGGRLDDEGNRLLAVVRGSANRMGNLIDDLLAFSRLGRQAINPAAVDMTAMAREVAAEIGRDRGGKVVMFEIGALPAAMADRTLVRQVWDNLLSNAAKYSGQRETPRVQVSGREGERETIYEVSDNGAGFDMKYYDKLFGVFQRLHTNAEFPGTGVGLAIVQRIIVRHGGKVWAEGKVGEGATFFFSLPRSA